MSRKITEGWVNSGKGKTVKPHEDMSEIFKFKIYEATDNIVVLTICPQGKPSYTGLMAALDKAWGYWSPANLGTLYNDGALVRWKETRMSNTSKKFRIVMVYKSED